MSERDFNEEWVRRASAVIPDGSCTLSKRPAAWPTGGPRYAESQDGGILFDVGGTDYIDLMCGLGALTVGNHPAIQTAVYEQLTRGAIFSLPSKLEAVVAERICDVIPCAEMVKFVKTGSESTSAAIRIARAATGREDIWALDGGYHGWHDWWASTAPEHPGVIDDRRVAKFGSPLLLHHALQNLIDALDMNPILPAAIIVEPERVGMGALFPIMDLAKRLGIVFIFDEMLSGGRLALGGVQELTGLTPDLATFGKAFGGGLPLAFVCGRRDLMQHAWPVSGTFSGDALALAACNAMLDLYKNENVIGQLKVCGAALYAAVEQWKDSLDLTIDGTPQRFWFTFGAGIDNRLAKSVFVQCMARLGVLVHPAVVFANAALTTRQISSCCSAIDHSLRLIADGRENLQSLLVGDMYQNSVR